MFIQPQKSFFGIALSLFSSLGTVAIATPSFAINLNFGTDFTSAGDVTSLNSVITTGSSFNIGTGGGAGSLDEAFLTIDPTAFDNAISGSTQGSAIKTTQSVNAGDVFSFNWNFVTSDLDQAFVTINDTTKTLNYVQALTSSSPFNYTFGSAGSFVLGIGAVDIGDTTGTSTLTLSNAQITAVPWETDALSVVGTTLLFGFGVWKKSKSKPKNDTNK